MNFLENASIYIFALISGENIQNGSCKIYFEEYCIFFKQRMTIVFDFIDRLIDNCNAILVLDQKLILKIYGCLFEDECKR